MCRWDCALPSRSQHYRLSIVFNSIELCFNNSFNALFYILEFAQKHKNYSLVNQVQSLNDLIFNLKKKFDEDKNSLTINSSSPKLKVLNPKRESA